MNEARNVTIYLDHQPHRVGSRRHTGAEIRGLATPPAADLWLDVEDAQDRQIPGDATIVPHEGMHFYSDKRITVFLDAKPYQIPRGTASEQELRALPTPAVGDEFVLFRDIPDEMDRRLAPGEIIAVQDCDRFISVREHRHREITIIINATQHAVRPGPISFDALAKLAFPVAPGPNPEYQISYRNGGPRRPEGTLLDGQSVDVRDGMVFNVTNTDKS